MGENFALCKIAYSGKLKKMWICWKIPSVLEAGVFAQCFPMQIEIIFESYTACISGFSSGRHIPFVQNSTIHLN
jgi:hypothetical protein